MICSKCIATKGAVDFILILYGDLYGHHHYHLFHEIITIVCALFPCFTLTSPKCLVSWTEDLKFCLHTGHGRNACGLQSLLLTIALVSVE